MPRTPSKSLPKLQREMRKRDRAEAKALRREQRRRSAAGSPAAAVGPERSPAPALVRCATLGCESIVAPARGGLCGPCRRRSAEAA